VSGTLAAIDSFRAWRTSVYGLSDYRSFALSLDETRLSMRPIPAEDSMLSLGIPSMPCDKRYARTLSQTAFLAGRRASSVSHPSEPCRWFNFRSLRTRCRGPSSNFRWRACFGAVRALDGSPASFETIDAWSAGMTISPRTRTFELTGEHVEQGDPQTGVALRPAPR
jgi:hypothetical protein